MYPHILCCTQFLGKYPVEMMMLLRSTLSINFELAKLPSAPYMLSEDMTSNRVWLKMWVSEDTRLVDCDH